MADAWDVMHVGNAGRLYLFLSADDAIFGAADRNQSIHGSLALPTKENAMTKRFSASVVREGWGGGNGIR